MSVPATSVQSAHGAKLLVEEKISDILPSMVRSELTRLTFEQQSQFVEEFVRKRKSTGMAYLASLLFFHYGYLGRWGMTALMWLATIVSMGIIGLIWWIVDLFRIPGMVRNSNRDISIAVLRDMKIIQSQA